MPLQQVSRQICPQLDPIQKPFSIKDIVPLKDLRGRFLVSAFLTRGAWRNKLRIYGFLGVHGAINCASTIFTRMPELQKWPTSSTATVQRLAVEILSPIHIFSF